MVHTGLAQVMGHLGHHRRRLARVLDHVAAHDADRQRAVQRRGGALAGRIADCNRQPVLVVRQEVEEVTTQLARRLVGEGDLGARHLRHLVG